MKKLLYKSQTYFSYYILCDYCSKEMIFGKDDMLWAYQTKQSHYTDLKGLIPHGDSIRLRREWPKRVKASEAPKITQAFCSEKCTWFYIYENEHKS